MKEPANWGGLGSLIDSLEISTDRERLFGRPRLSLCDKLRYWIAAVFEAKAAQGLLIGHDETLDALRTERGILQHSVYGPCGPPLFRRMVLKGRAN